MRSDIVRESDLTYLVSVAAIFMVIGKGLSDELYRPGGIKSINDKLKDPREDERRE